MFDLNQYVFVISGPYAGEYARVNRNDGPITGFRHRVTILANTVRYLWMGDEVLTALPEGFLPWADQGNIE